MNPEQILARMRHEHGVSDQFAERFLPLVRRAAKTSPDIRRRILQLVERSFERQAARKQKPPGRVVVSFTRADATIIERVARVLHSWEPAPWLMRWTTDGG